MYNDIPVGLQSIKLESEQGRQSLHCFVILVNDTW